VGKLMYLITKIFGECANSVRELARFFGCPGQSHWAALEKLVGYLKYIQDDIKITYRKPKELWVINYVDSNFSSNKDDRKSITGMQCTLGGTLTGWASRTQRSVTLSSTEAEYVALTSCCQDARYVQQMVQELTSIVLTAVLLEDNQGAIYLVRNQRVGQRTKHIDIRMHFIRELYEQKLIDVKYVETELNAADIFTKNPPEKLFATHAARLRNGNALVWSDHSNYVNMIEALTHAFEREDVERAISQMSKQ
jgi:hypothetical protein